MLAPDDRKVLLETLRPPPGYAVDRTIITTYSLDLLALLTAPLAFSLFDRLAGREEGSADGNDTFGLLHAVREHAGRLSVFCQAGAIHKPPKYRPLFPYLEGSVVQVGARSDEGVFHAKLVVQRFTRKEAPTRYRVIVPSRNLTFDSSWDTMLVLEGELKGRTRAFAGNHPLADLVAALPELAARKPSKRIVGDVSLVADELRRVEFEAIEDVEELRFWALGIDDKRRWPFEAADRMLIVSPFVTASTLARLTESGKGHVLLSRANELDPLAARDLAPFESVHTLHEGASPEPDDDDPEPSPVAPSPRGLHAKLYVAEVGRMAHVWTGSANATHAAFEHNVEVLVQLTGKRSRLGVDALLGEKGRTGLRALLMPYAPPTEPSAQTAAQIEIARGLRVVQATLAKLDLSAVIERLPETSPEQYSVNLKSRARLAFPKGVEATVRCWPIALSDTRALAITPQPAGVLARFTPCSFGALTSFFAFEATVAVGEESSSATFVLHVALVDVPADREARVLQGLLDDPAKVMRFLRMLLAADPFEALAALEERPAEGEGNGPAAGPLHDVPLLEMMLRAFDRDPQRLLGVDRLFTELRRAPGGAALLPAELAAVWDPIWTAHREREGGRR